MNNHNIELFNNYFTKKQNKKKILNLKITYKGTFIFKICTVSVKFVDHYSINSIHKHIGYIIEKTKQFMEPL